MKETTKATMEFDFEENLTDEDLKEVSKFINTYLKTYKSYKGNKVVGAEREQYYFDFDKEEDVARFLQALLDCDCDCSCEGEDDCPFYGGRYCIDKAEEEIERFKNYIKELQQR